MLLLAILVILVIITITTIYLLRSRWSVGWKITGSVPAIALALLVQKLAIDTTINHTSHNIWPFELLIWGGAGVIYLLVFHILRWVLQRNLVVNEE